MKCPFSKKLASTIKQCPNPNSFFPDFDFRKNYKNTFSFGEEVYDPEKKDFRYQDEKDRKDLLSRLESGELWGNPYYGNSEEAKGLRFSLHMLFLHNLWKGPVMKDLKEWDNEIGLIDTEGDTTHTFTFLESLVSNEEMPQLIRTSLEDSIQKQKKDMLEKVSFLRNQEQLSDLISTGKTLLDHILFSYILDLKEEIEDGDDQVLKELIKAYSVLELYTSLDIEARDENPDYAKRIEKFGYFPLLTETVTQDFHRMMLPLFEQEETFSADQFERIALNSYQARLIFAKNHISFFSLEDNLYNTTDSLVYVRDKEIILPKDAVLDQSISLFLGEKRTLHERFSSPRIGCPALMKSPITGKSVLLDLYKFQIAIMRDIYLYSRGEIDETHKTFVF